MISPLVTYTLDKPIRSKIFNHKIFVNDINIYNVLEDINTLPCCCENSEFKDEHHGHIITGELRIVRNNRLRKLLCKGPKYREPTPVNWDRAKQSLISGIDEAIKNVSNKLGLHNSLFPEL